MICFVVITYMAVLSATSEATSEAKTIETFKIKWPKVKVPKSVTSALSSAVGAVEKVTKSYVATALKGVDDLVDKAEDVAKEAAKETKDIVKEAEDVATKYADLLLEAALRDLVRTGKHLVDGFEKIPEGVNRLAERGKGLGGGIIPSESQIVTDQGTTTDKAIKKTKSTV